MQITSRLSKEEDREFKDFLHQQIKTFNNNLSPHHLAARQPEAVSHLYAVVKGQAGNFLGGISAKLYWGWLDIDDFYLPEHLRGQGLGASLLDTVEKIAITNGSQRSFLSTFSFQARGFYEKSGYFVTGELKDYPPGSSLFWMRKDFATDP